VKTAYALRRLFRIPSIFLTSHADIETRRRAMTADPIAFFSKPACEDELARAFRCIA
jgi:FixJ family two-component response regulator